MGGKTQLTSPLCKIDLQADEGRMLINHAVGDISVSCDTGQVVFLIYEHHYRHLQLWQFNEESSLFFVDKRKDYLRCPAPSCSISPNGKWLVQVAYHGYNSFLEVYTIKENQLHYKRKISNVCTNIHSEHFEQLVCVEFSPDSEFFAVGSQVDNKILVLSTETWQVITEIDNTEKSTTIWGVFNPLSIHQQFISLTNLGFLGKWDTSPLYNNQKLDRVNNMCISKWSAVCPHVTSCPKFSPDGNMFAIAFSDASIIVIDPNLFEKLWSIACPEFQVDFQTARLIARNMGWRFEAKRVCFSKSCEYLAVSYVGSVVSVWLLPRMHFTLKDLCRTKIISMCPSNLLHELPIPDGLKNYLLYQS